MTDTTKQSGSKAILLCKDDQGNLIGVAPNSYKRAEVVRQVADDNCTETYGIIRRVSLADAMLGEKDD